MLNSSGETQKLVEKSIKLFEEINKSLLTEKQKNKFLKRQKEFDITNPEKSLEILDILYKNIEKKGVEAIKQDNNELMRKYSHQLTEIKHLENLIYCDLL
jgi:hypothetical protein